MKADSRFSVGSIAKTVCRCRCPSAVGGDLLDLTAADPSMAGAAGGDTFTGHAGGTVGYASVMDVDSEHGLTIVASANEIDLAAVYVNIMLPIVKELNR